MKIFSVLVAATLGLATISWAAYAPLPFQSCVATSPKVLTLSIEQLDPEGQSIDLGIHLKNISPNDATVDRRDPERLFAAQVTDSSGHAVALTSKGKKLYGPEDPNSVYFESSVGPHPLLPGEELILHWKISENFDLSKLGSFKVQLKESIDLPDLTTTVCSNFLAIQIRR